LRVGKVPFRSTHVPRDCIRFVQPAELPWIVWVRFREYECIRILRKSNSKTMSAFLGLVKGASDVPVEDS
jgi:hypothetical protein